MGELLQGTDRLQLNGCSRYSRMKNVLRNIGSHVGLDEMASSLLQISSMIKFSVLFLGLVHTS